MFVYSSNLTMTGTAVHGNSAKFGGGVVLLGATASFTNTTLGANSADQDGGAVALYHNVDGASSLDLNSTTVATNRAYAGLGGGIYIEDTNSRVNLQNSVLAYNVDGCSRSVRRRDQLPRDDVLERGGVIITAGPGCTVADTSPRRILCSARCRTTAAQPATRSSPGVPGEMPAPWAAVP